MGEPEIVPELRPCRLLRLVRQPARHQALHAYPAPRHSVLRVRGGLGLVLHRSCDAGSAGRDIPGVMNDATLVGIGFSPWTQKARWALDHHGLGYRYHEHLILFGMPQLHWQMRKWREPLTVPAL